MTSEMVPKIGVYKCAVCGKAPAVLHPLVMIEDLEAMSALGVNVEEFVVTVPLCRAHCGIFNHERPINRLEKDAVTVRKIEHILKESQELYALAIRKVSGQRIGAALKALGMKGTAEIAPVGPQEDRRYTVKVNGKWFGVYDLIKDTFID